MRNPAAAVVNSIFGIALVAVGVPALLWALAWSIKTAWAFDVVYWIVRNYADPLPDNPVHVANEWIQRGRVVPIGFGGLVGCILGALFLRAARIATLHPDDSDSGKLRLFLAEASHPGRPVAGRIRVNFQASPGEVFEVGLVCETSGSRHHVALHETREVRLDGRGELPFRFETPVTAPPANARYEQGIYHWTLYVMRPGAFFPLGNWQILLDPPPVAALQAHRAQETPEEKAALDAIEASPLAPKLLAHHREELRKLPRAELAARARLHRSARILYWGAAIVFALVSMFAILLG